jgi:uncharacterized membrane protein YagU involved in acid resistance
MCGGRPCWSAWLRRQGLATLNYALLGRWCLHWRRGIWFHRSIRDAAAWPAETALGWSLHYVTGIVFALVLVCLVESPWLAKPTLAPALLFGGATVLLPWVVLQPALGVGLASRHTPRPWLARAAGLATHLVFGAGLYLSAAAIAHL